MRLTIVGFGLALAGVSACGGSTPPKASEAPAASAAPIAAATVVAIPAVDAGDARAPTAAPSAPPAPPQPDRGCEPTSPVTVPELFRPLFERGRRFKYAFDDVTDPHAPDGGVIHTKQTLDCEVHALRRYREAVGSEIVCWDLSTNAPPSADPDRKMGFLANERALWSTGLGLPDDEAGAHDNLRFQPLMDAKAESSQRTYEEPNGYGSETPDRCTDVVSVKGPLVCRDTRCKREAGYGYSTETRCLSAAKGLVSWYQKNVEGPITTQWKLLDGKAKPLPSFKETRPPAPPCAD